MTIDNVLWGAERIRGELPKLGIHVSKRTIQKYMREVRPPGRHGQTWSTFIRNHGPEVWACDFLQHYDVLFRPVFAFFFVVHGTREVVHFNVTLLAAHAVVYAGGSVSAILLGIPGSPPNAATVIDGYPMARNGLGGLAMGAALTSSGLGGLFGVLMLVAILPVLEPIVLLFGSPETFFILFAAWIARITYLRGRVLAPLLLCIVVLGTFASKNNPVDVVYVFVMATVGAGALHYRYAMEVMRFPYMVGGLLAGLQLAATIAAARASRRAGRREEPETATHGHGEIVAACA